MDDNNEKFRRGEVDFEMAMYDWAWMSQEQLRQTKLGVLPIEQVDYPIDDGEFIINEYPVEENQRRKRAAPQYMADPAQCSVTMPAGNFSWLDKGKVAPVQNQGSCSSCYIFSGIAALESAVAIKYNKAPVKLSEQQPLECIRNGVNGGCNLGLYAWAWENSRPNGAVAEASYKKYNAIDSGTCTTSMAKEANSVVEKWLQIPAGDEAALKCHLVKYGPISVSMDFSGKLMGYKSGVFTSAGSDCSPTKQYNHAVVVIGYGKSTSLITISLKY